MLEANNRNNASSPGDELFFQDIISPPFFLPRAKLIRTLRRYAQTYVVSFDAILYI